MTRPLGDLEAELSYSFQDRALLRRALTHASVRTTGRAKPVGKSGRFKGAMGARGAKHEMRMDYERLEFLGDRVLGLAIAELLWAADLEATEGELARRYNHLVCKDACATVAGFLGLGAYLILGAAEDDSGGREKTTILGDACEGVLGAIFVDAGFDQARDIIVKHWAPLIDTMPAVAVDPKSQLQEWAQGQGLALPRYKTLGRSGPDHDPIFKTRVSVSNFPPTIGEGPNKRSAEQAAAQALLNQEILQKAGIGRDGNRLGAGAGGDIDNDKTAEGSDMKNG